MSRPIRVSIVEDCPHDAELLVNELRLAQFEPLWRRVDTESDYLASLHPDLDLIITAAIMEHTFSAGVGYHWKQFELDLAYQYYLPATQDVGQSGLRSGEYSNSSVQVSAQEFALTTTVHF